MTLLLLLLGFALLAAGGDRLVRGAVGVARRLGMPSWLVGVTLVGFGTSLPELLTAVTAALAGAPGLAVGNVVGASVANLLLILGATAATAAVVVGRAAWRRDVAALGLAALVAAALALWGQVGRPLGALLVLLLAGLVAVMARGGGAGEAEDGERPALGPSLLWLVVGVGLTLLGARLVVRSAVAIAQGLGVSDAVIGLTVVAVGTTLPELVTCVMAARKGHAEVAWGNIVGSNLFNVLGILGVAALVQPFTVPPEIARLDAWVLVAATALVAALARSGTGLGRREGAALAALYLGYLGVLAAGASVPAPFLRSD